MFYTIYILFSLKDKKLYVGCTQDIDKRFKRHESGYVGATKHRRPLVLIHFETHEKTIAFQRERFLKSLWGSREKKKILNLYLKKVLSAKSF